MQNLHEHWGLGTGEIAKALGISQRVARLARDSSEAVDAASHLDDFLERLHVQHRIDEPGAWMSASIVDGFTVTRWDVYIGGHADLVMLNARGTLDDEAMLGSFDPNWRVSYWTSFVTFAAADGSLSTRGKTYEEVRRQI
jgi:hypothetical protein